MNSGQFQKGNKPWNAGTRFIAGGRSEETQFKVGSKPANWKPVGTYVVDSYGYLEKKVSEEKGARHVRWKLVHRIVWEEENGQIPRGSVVIFKPGMFTNKLEEITTDKLELVTRRELMQKNSVHNLPKELAEIVQLRGAINRQINKRV